jgi:DNA-binding winged helix-turn-helix (wHTH) protein/Tol biopolymer transport system component
MNVESKRVYAFGGFRLDAQERLLIHHGKPVPLAPKAFEVLLLLVENAGRLVDKDDLIKQVWADTVVEEGNLTKHISLLRKVLGEAENGQEYISTVPKRGYRFVGRVTEVMENGPKPGEGGGADTAATRSVAPISSSPQAGKDAGATVAVAVAEGDHGALPQKQKGASGSPVVRPGGSKRRAVLLASGATFILTALLSYWWFSPSPVPRVVRTVEITHSGRVEPWARIVTDGGRLYYLEREGQRPELVQTSVAGGEAEPVRTPYPNTRILDISPDQSEFLVGSFATSTEMPLWTMPVAGGSPRRVGEITASDAIWCPDGHRILYAKGFDLYLVQRDGSQARKFASTGGSPWSMTWSPDGRVLRFTMNDSGNTSSSLWEVAADGTRLHPLLPGWNTPPWEFTGRWTPDGRYFFFSSGRGGGGHNLWALRETSSFLRRRAQPVQLTSGPIAFWDGTPSKDGKRLFVFGRQPQVEMARYEAKSGQFLPYLPGTGAWSLGVSRDGKWIAYDVGGALWRARADGSARLQLTFPPEGPHDPHWSPDGKQIAFWTTLRDRPAKMRIVSSEGGPSREVAPEWPGRVRPDWSPDGGSLVFEVSESSAPASRPNALYVVNLKTSQVSEVPGSEGLIVPRWSPAGQSIAAVTEDNHKLMLFDFKTRQWTPVATGTLLTGGTWSRDGEYLYFQDIQEADEPVYRLRAGGHQRERVTGCEKLLRSGAFRCALLGLDLDNSPLLHVLRRFTDIYALDLDLP